MTRPLTIFLLSLFVMSTAAAGCAMDIESDDQNFDDQNFDEACEDHCEFSNDSYSARIDNLWAVANGMSTPARSSRLGAFRSALSASGDRTVGRGVAGCIAGIYLLWGTAGERGIGNVFATSQARTLLSRPNYDLDAHRQMASIEYAYWEQEDLRNGDFYTGVAVNVSVENRVRLQYFMGDMGLPWIISGSSRSSVYNLFF